MTAAFDSPSNRTRLGELNTFENSTLSADDGLIMGEKEPAESR